MSTVKKNHKNDTHCRVLCIFAFIYLNKTNKDVVYSKDNHHSPHYTLYQQKNCTNNGQNFFILYSMSS